MPTFFRHSVETSIGTTPVDLVSIPDGVRATVIGCNLVNVSESVITTNVYVVDASSTQAYYVKEAVIPPNTTLKVTTQGEKLILPTNAILRCESSSADSIDATVSYVEITT